MYGPSHGTAIPEVFVKAPSSLWSLPALFLCPCAWQHSFDFFRCLVQAMNSCPWRIRHHERPPSLPLVSLLNWKEFSALAFQEELPRAFCSGCQTQGRGSHIMAAKGEGLLGQHMIYWLLFWQPTQNYWFECVFRNEGWSCKGACYSSLIELE